jgi:arginine/serine-rich splicing factor 1/9
MREAGDVCFADVFKDGTGVVEFLRLEDMKYAIKKLDDSRFRSHEGEVAYIRVREDAVSGGGYEDRRDGYRDG